MRTHVFLIDVSRHIGLVQHVVNAAQAYASEFPPELIEWFTKPSQGAHFGDGAAQVHHVSSGVSPWLSIKARIDALSGDGSSDRVFHVLSYDGQVLGAATKLCSSKLTISSFSLAALPKDSKTSGPTPIDSTAQPIRPHAASGSIPLVDAIELTKRLLAERGHDSPGNALKQLFLRRLLTEGDSRARKNPYDPLSISLISNIVNDGLARGWLGRSRRDDKPGTEHIWLIRPAPVKATVETKSIPAPVTPPATAPSMSLSAFPSASTPVVEKGHERTVQMQKCLKDRYMYSPKLIRDYIFAALRSAMGSLSATPVTVSQLVRQASTKAEGDAKGEGVKYDFWRAAHDGVLENLVGAGALLDEHKATIKPGPHARGTKVYELQLDFEDRCEAYLLEYLITALGDVTWPRDRTAIAHALFKVGPSRKEVYELQEKVDELLVRLRDRVVEKKDGTLVVQP